MNDMRKSALLLLPLFLLLVFVLPVGAQDKETPADGGFQIVNPLGCETTDPDQPPALCVVRKIIRNLLIIAAPLAVLMVMFGAFQILTAGGKPERITSGRNTILYAAIGFAVVLVADGVVVILQNILGTE